MFVEDVHEEHSRDILTAKDIDHIMEILIDLFWKDMGSVRGFLKGAMIALDKAQEYRAQELCNRAQFKKEIGAALTSAMKGRGVEIRTEKELEQTTFLS